ncbi:uncharacterized protein LOC128800622 isoform X2 [Vidua chalybeata]|uniref:uncharacterized protein LOC128800622 isoform X2 n=1 Tax=Vidua chalybeata TaxID=81927 RepID=UPI0023A7D424|nr:uncharacterized protein LOC128800622 isoform X2 [Vidua chalybeata]
MILRRDSCPAPCTGRQCPRAPRSPQGPAPPCQAVPGRARRRGDTAGLPGMAGPMTWQPGALRVTQHPGELQVTAGDTVALECQVEVAESEALLRMEWVRAGRLGVLCATRLHFGTPLPLFPCPRRAPGVRLAWHPPRATLSLPQVQGNDSGLYLCRVTLEIPRHCTATGNGTELRVTPAPGGHQTALLWGLLGGLGGTALLLGMALLARRCCHRSPGADPSNTAVYMSLMSLSGRDLTKLPPPELKISPYQRELQQARGPSLPPRP